MATATAFCPSNTPFRQHSLPSPRSQYGSVSRRNTLSSSSSAAAETASFASNLALSTTDQLTNFKLIKSDENNNNEHSIDDSSVSDSEDILHIASDHEDVDIDMSDDDIDYTNIDIEEYLSYIGLRLKTRKSTSPIPTFSPLIKEYAHPTCFLPMLKYTERIRQAFRLLKPPIKHLSSTRDFEVFCTTDENAKAQSLLPRPNLSSRAKSILPKHSKCRKSIQKSDLINMATTAFRKSTGRTSKNNYVRSVLECNVVLDRLEQATIDKIIQDAIDADKQMTSKNSSSSSSCATPSKTHYLTTISKHETTERQTTVMSEQITVKRQPTTLDMQTPKRFKAIENTSTMTNHSNKTDDSSSSSTYQRIYLKCFVCSKRQFVDAEATENAVLHTHWLEHAGDLSLNIYDSEIDSILTRVVEFFNLPRQHLLEGKIKTVYIYNSKEIRSTSATNLSPDDSYIVID